MELTAQPQAKKHKSNLVSGLPQSPCVQASAAERGSPHVRKHFPPTEEQRKAVISVAVYEAINEEANDALPEGTYVPPFSTMSAWEHHVLDKEGECQSALLNAIAANEGQLESALEASDYGLVRHLNESIKSLKQKLCPASRPEDPQATPRKAGTPVEDLQATPERAASIVVTKVEEVTQGEDWQPVFWATLVGRFEFRLDRIEAAVDTATVDGIGDDLVQEARRKLAGFRLSKRVVDRMQLFKGMQGQAPASSTARLKADAEVQMKA